MVITKREGNDNFYLFFCEGCKCCHFFQTGIGRWSWNENFEKPTVTPSILARGEFSERINKNLICHSVITDGKIEFMDDSTHELAGLTIELKEF